MLACVIQVHVHLAGVGMRELSALEIDHNEAAELAMEKEQIDPIPFVANAEAALTPDKSEIAAEFQKETLQVECERFFDFGFRVFVFESKKFEDVWVFDFFFRCDGVFAFCSGAFLKDLRLVSRQRGALVKQRINLAVQLPHAPAAAQCFGLVKGARLLVF